MFPSSIFKKSEFVKFKQVVQEYCDAQNYHDMNLTDDEIAQLSWYMDSITVTPEARGQDIIDKFHFEIKRSLARAYSFELILRGDTSAYKEFVMGQNENAVLSFNCFEELVREAKLLDKNERVAVRVSCFLTISEKAKAVLKEKSIYLSADSEVFLSQLPDVLIENPLLFPITCHLGMEQIMLLKKAFWPNMHLRHMLYTEGGDNMTKTFVEGVLNQELTRKDFLVWKWRWLSNLFGFEGGLGAKYFDQNTYFLVSTVMGELDKLFAQSTHVFLDNYLLKRARLAGFTEESLELTINEQQLLGHVAAYCHQILVLSPNEGLALYEAYMLFKKEFHHGEILASLYADHRRDRLSLTPTYVPAVINNAYLIFKNKFHMIPHEALKNAALFMFQLLNHLYALPRDKQISCMKLAKESHLHEILEKWILHRHTYEFELTDNFELNVRQISNKGLAP